MFDIYKVAFFGHRYVEDVLAIEQQLLPILQELFEKHMFVDFYVGRNGEFDEIAASLVRLVQRANKDRNCAMTTLTLVLPYPTKDMEYYEKELCGTEKFLLAVSNHVKGELPLELLIRSYDILKTERHAKEERRLISGFYGELLQKAGLSERDDSEIANDEDD